MPRCIGFLQSVIASRQKGNSGSQHSEVAISLFKLLKSRGK